MLVDLDEYGDAYRALLLNDAATSPVVVFVSQDDCDSVAAFRTLCALFAADGARFSAYPVHSYSHLQQLAAEILPGPQARRVLSSKEGTCCRAPCSKHWRARVKAGAQRCAQPVERILAAARCDCPGASEADPGERLGAHEKHTAPKATDGALAGSVCRPQASTTDASP